MDTHEGDISLEHDGEEFDPFLLSIWDCDKIKLDKDENGNDVWRCLHCPTKSDGEADPGFRGKNATKCLRHVCQIAGGSIRPCRGNIPPRYKKRYHDLHMRLANLHNAKQAKKKRASEAIVDSQARVLADQRIKKNRAQVNTCQQVAEAHRNQKEIQRQTSWPPLSQETISYQYQ